MGKAYEAVMESRKELVEKLLSVMENGILPWTQGWDAAGAMPHNPVSGVRYRGGNRLRLMFAAWEKGYPDNRWMTFAQAKEKDWNIRKGEKGILCEKWIFTKEEKQTDPLTGKEEMVTVELDPPRVSYFVVFNAAQVEGIPEEEKKKLPESGCTETADRLIRSSECPVVESFLETEAYYSPSKDEIHLPSRDYFHSAEAFAATLLHEMGHSTGAKTRLNRDMGSGFGSEGYAREELVAELSSVFVQADLGMQLGGRMENHAAYLQSWMKALRENPNVLFQASADAAKASDFLMGAYNRCLEREKETEMKENYVVSFKKNEVTQIRLVKADNSEQARKYFESIEPAADVYGCSIDNIGYERRGAPINTVPEGWRPTEEEKEEEEEFDM